MLTPKWLLQCAAGIVRIYTDAERSILDDMARRISTYDFYIPAEQYQEEKLRMMGLTHKEIVRALSARTGRCMEETERLMKEGVNASLNRDREVYTAAGVSVVNGISAEMRGILRDGLRQTNGTFYNLTRTTANTATKQFENTLDLAWMQVTTGAMDSGAATRQAIKSLCRSGIQSIAYQTGHTDRLDVAAARAIRTGVNQTALRAQVQLASEFGADLVEVTAHAGARPSHAEWQGGVYSLSGKTRGYQSLVDATGYGTGEGLGGWNCRHSVYPFFDGQSRTYAREELAEYERPDAVEYSGRKMSLYEAEQMQRGMERSIRRWKREESALKAAGQNAAEASGKVKLWNVRYQDFCSKTGLKMQRDRTVNRVTKSEKYGLSQNQKYDKMISDIKEMGAIPKAAKVSVPARPIATGDLSFDDKHINRERRHNVTEVQAKAWIQNASMSVKVWNGRYERYYSVEGVAYVEVTARKIRTAYAKSEFSENVQKIMEVLKSNGY